MEEARSEAEEALRINPQFSMERWTKTLAYKEQKEVDRYMDALRKAGLK
jgi:adenylate cyclase